MKELKKHIDEEITKLEAWDKSKTLTDWGKGRIFAFKEISEQLKLCEVGVTLPNIYDGSLNSKRIKEIDIIAENWNVDKSTVRRLFCDGADWYKQQIKDSGN